MSADRQMARRRAGLEGHYLQRARDYCDSVERQDGIPIDNDPARAALLIAIMHGDATLSDMKESRARHEEAIAKLLINCRKQTEDLDCLLDALLSLKPPFPGDPSSFSPISEPSINRTYADV